MHVGILIATLLTHAGAVPPERMAQLLARSVGYDKNLKARAGDKLVIAIVHNPTDAAAAEHATQMQKAFASLSGVRVQGIPIEVVAFAFAKTFAADLKDKQVDIVYACPGFADLAGITSASQKLKLLSVGSAADVERGVSLGAGMDGDKVVLVVNRASAKAEGVDFADQLLSIAKAIK
ncbi:MAG: DUF4154 domain-containing protein [Deltaproteobacteria bacterium]|nr:DUF4154 domain-containing protein [Deltaproteobacteria bacterium]